MQAPKPTARLEYATGSTIGRRWRRRIAPMILLIAMGILTAIYGPRAWRHAQLLRLQNRCMTAELPSDRPLAEYASDPAQMLLLTRPAEYQPDPVFLSGAARADPRWKAMAAELTPSLVPRSNLAWPRSTTFLHERRTPSGSVRLVILEGFDHVTVIEPAGWFTRPRVLSRTSLSFARNDANTIANADRHSGGSCLMAGTIDPVNGSQFTVLMILGAESWCLEYRLGDDDNVSVSLKPLEPATPKEEDDSPCFETSPARQ